MLKVIRRIFSFNDWSVHHPGEPHPGDMLDAQFDEIVDRVDVWEERIRKIVNDDGKVAHGAIDEHSLTPRLDQRLRDDIDQKIQPALDQLSAAMALAGQLKEQSTRDAREVRDASLSIGQSLAELKDRRDIAIEDVNAALAQAREMIAAAQGAQAGWSNAQKDAFSADQNAMIWATASMDWAEYMPGPLPSDIIALMGITGDHWSSRWWANQAAQIVAQFNVDTAAVLEAAARAEAAAASAEADKISAEANATAAAISASSASTSAATATSAAGQATDSADQAASDAAATDNLYDQFDDRYLGSKAAPPTADNDGNPLLNGALYWNDTVKRTEVWNGTSWQAMGAGGSVSTEAADVHFAPAGSIASDNVQAALQEIDGDVQALTTATDTRLDAIEGDLSTATTWTEISGKPSTFPPSAHVHPTSEITGLDAAQTAQDTAIANKVAKAGDTMTGNLTIAPLSGPTNLYLDRPNVAAGAANVIGRVAGLNRWSVQLGNNIAESGGNVGSDFALVRNDDAGAALPTCFYIARSTGIVGLLLGATTLAPAAADSSTRIPTTAWVAGELAGKVAKAGDTMTGDLTISLAAPGLNLDKINGNNGELRFRTGTSTRWEIQSTNASESGSNIGSNLSIVRFTDAGASIDTPFSIARSTGIVAMPLGATTLTQTAGNNTTSVATTAFVKAAVDTGDALQVLKAGDTMTGGLIIKPASYATLVLDKPVGAFGNYVGGKVNNLFRWVLYLGSPTAESGSNVGSDLVINRYDDAGVVIAGAAPLNIYRSTGFAVFGGEVTATGTLRTKAIGAGNAALYLTDSDGITERALIYANSAGDLLFRYGKTSYTASLGDVDGGLSLPSYIVLPADGGGYKLNVSGTAYIAQASGAVYIVSSAAGNFVHGNIATKDWSIYTDNSARMQIIASTGYLVANVNAQKPGGGDWLATSDARIKTVLGDYGSGLAAILALRPVRYTYKGNDTPAVPDNSIPDPEADPDAELDPTPATVPYRNSIHYAAATNDTEYVGLIAQEAETVLPSLVTMVDGYIDGEPVTDLRNLDTTELTFTLINAVKELAIRIEALEAAPIATKGTKK